MTEYRIYLAPSEILLVHQLLCIPIWQTAIPDFWGDNFQSHAAMSDHKNGIIMMPTNTKCDMALRLWKWDRLNINWPTMGAGIHLFVTVSYSAICDDRLQIVGWQLKKENRTVADDVNVM